VKVNGCVIATTEDQSLCALKDYWIDEHEVTFPNPVKGRLAHNTPSIVDFFSNLSAQAIIAHNAIALTSGTKLGPYEIQSALGAGGMGEVYRARDTRLDRALFPHRSPEFAPSMTALG